MKHAIALRHVAFEDLDALAAPLVERGFALSYRDAPTDDLGGDGIETADLLVVLGGPIGAYEEREYPFLTAEIALIERRLAAGRPVLGLCLGAQLMARALGARAYATGKKEIGWAPVALSDAGRKSPLATLGAAPVLHWHGDTFDLPQGAIHLASTAQTPNQAFAWARHGLALQFHIETTGRGLERWLVGHAVEIAGAPGVSVAALREGASRFAPGLVAGGRSVLAGWLDILDAS